jgi:hypothetical protein
MENRNIVLCLSTKDFLWKINLQDEYVRESFKENLPKRSIKSFLIVNFIYLIPLQVLMKETQPLIMKKNILQ